jgi:hypothetical protein
VLVTTSSIAVGVSGLVDKGVAQITEAEGSKEESGRTWAKDRNVSMADDGVMGTTTMAVEDAVFAEDLGMVAMLAGTPGGVDRLTVVRPSSGLPE